MQNLKKENSNSRGTKTDNSINYKQTRLAVHGEVSFTTILVDPSSDIQIVNKNLRVFRKTNDNTYK